jgi:hypothetical protein
MTDQFDKLRNAYAITLGERLMPGAGSYGVGAITVVMPDKQAARAWLDEFANDLASLDRGPADVVPVGDPWKFMRRAAGEGLAGIEGANAEAFPGRFMFMVRVEEAGATLPTVLASITEKGWDACLTRTGVANLDHAEVLHWQRFDILDQVTGSWGQLCPFRCWEQGEALYELGSDSIVVLLANVPLLGNWNSTEGAFAFFTSEEQATHYHHHHLGDGRNRMLFVGPGAPKDPHEAMASLRPTPVADLRARLEELSRISPLAAWCVNPDGHRENSAYGRLFYGEHHPVGLPDDGSEAPRMAAVSGIWKVMPGNTFEMDRSMPPWTGRDTIRWSGGQSLQLLPLDRSFVMDPGLDSIELEEHLTESEAEDVVAVHLDSISLEGAWQQLSAAVDQVANRLDQFHILCWDAVTGGGADFPWRFNGFSAALRHLAAYEREHDQHHRVEGAVSCGHIGFSGSGDAEFEELRSARFRLGLRRLALRVLRRGYRPDDAADLVALCNGTLSTLHVDFAGYAKDLLWTSPPEQADEILEALEIAEHDRFAWARSADAFVDARGKRLVAARVGDAAWALLLPQVRHFLGTAMTHLEDQGHAPQLDYAPISIEVVKALEVELVALLDGFRRSHGAAIPGHDANDMTDRVLVEFFEGKKPTLGNMPFLLKRPKGKASQLRLALHRYLASLPNGAFVTSASFVKGLQKAIDTYRNRGAHDSPILEGICRECVDVLVGHPDAPGYIPRVVGWKSAPPTT